MTRCLVSVAIIAQKVMTDAVKIDCHRARDVEHNLERTHRGKYQGMISTRKEADELLMEAELCNQLGSHSRVAAHCAERIVSYYN